LPGPIDLQDLQNRVLLCLTVEIEFPPEEAAQVLVDEVIERVLLRVVVEPFFEDGAVGLGPIGPVPFGARAMLPDGEPVVAEVLDDALGGKAADRQTEDAWSEEDIDELEEEACSAREISLSYHGEIRPPAVALSPTLFAAHPQCRNP